MTPATINYYEVLKCCPSDSIKDIKKSYQALVLKYHPDKQNVIDPTKDIEKFYQIDEAWKILRDPDKRKKYDAEMLQHKFDDDPIVHAKVFRKEFEWDSENQNYTYPCRCSGFFILPEDCIESSVCDTSGSDFSKESTSEKNSINKSSNENGREMDEDEIYIECDECSFVIQLLSDSQSSR